MLNAEQAKALHSDAGIQFFRRDGKDYRKVNYVGAGYGDWLTSMTVWPTRISLILRIDNLLDPTGGTPRRQKAGGYPEGMMNQCVTGDSGNPEKVIK